MTNPKDDPLWKEAVASAKLTKHQDDIRRGLRNPTRHLIILDQFGMPKAVKAELGDLCLWSEVEPLLDELYVLRNKVEWLQQAERLVIWDGQQWKVRQEILPR